MLTANRSRGSRKLAVCAASPALIQRAASGDGRPRFVIQAEYTAAHRPVKQPPTLGAEQPERGANREGTGLPDGRGSLVVRCSWMSGAFPTARGPPPEPPVAMSPGGVWP